MSNANRLFKSKANNKRKAAPSKSPQSSILKYFKKATKIIMPRNNLDPFGTPSTIASNNLYETPETPGAANEIESDLIENDEAAPATRPHDDNNSSCTPASSSETSQQKSLQTPPTPNDSIIMETPPSPSSELIDMGSPPTGELKTSLDANECVVKSQQHAFGTPKSDEDETNNMEYGTPPTDEADTTNKENTTTNIETPSNATIQSVTTNSKTHKKTPNRKTQLYLDLGQKSFASTKICPVCSSLIVHGTKDELNHAQVCKSYKEGVTCLGFKKERCVGRFSDERIVEVRAGDAGVKKVEEVKCIVDKELGFAVSNKQNKLQGMTSYLYISKKRIVGLLLVKRIHQAYELLYEQSGNSVSISRRTTPHPAILGIHQIWVHHLHRQKGIATKLLESARGSFTFGMVIPREKVAFSSPTEDGVRLARGYFGQDERILVYDVC